MFEDDPGADIPPAANHVGPVDYGAALEAAQGYASRPDIYNPPSPAQVATLLASMHPPQWFWPEQ